MTQRSFNNKSASEDLTNLFLNLHFWLYYAGLYALNQPACLFTRQPFYLQGLLFRALTLSHEMSQD